MGYKKKREKFSAQKFLLCFCLRVYQNLNACPFKSMLKILVLNQGKKWFQMQTWLLTSNKWKRLIWICSQYIEEILELVLSMTARKYFRIWVLRIISLGRIERCDMPSHAINVFLSQQKWWRFTSSTHLNMSLVCSHKLAIHSVYCCKISVALNKHLNFSAPSLADFFLQGSWRSQSRGTTFVI